MAYEALSRVIVEMNNMRLELPKPGKYILAVSGGVDSVVLLHLMSGLEGYDLVVAHFNHGIRSDSNLDAELVAALAIKHNLIYEYGFADLGPNASEEVARTARYKFLRQIKDKYEALAILTAHHQNDVLETAIINLSRGTGRRGLTALSSHHDLLRPMLAVSKVDIQDYAINNNLQWREDSTNQDDSYLRNYIRKNVIPKFKDESKDSLIKIIDDLSTTNRSLDSLIDGMLDEHGDQAQIDRIWFNSLDHASSMEVMASWLRNKEISFNSKNLNLLVVFAKVGRLGHVIPVEKGYNMAVEREHLALKTVER